MVLGGGDILVIYGYIWWYNGGTRWYTCDIRLYLDGIKLYNGGIGAERSTFLSVELICIITSRYNEVK